MLVNISIIHLPQIVLEIILNYEIFTLNRNSAQLALLQRIELQMII